MATGNIREPNQRRLLRIPLSGGPSETAHPNRPGKRTRFLLRPHFVLSEEIEKK